MREIKFRAWHKDEKVLGRVNVLTDEGVFIFGAKPTQDVLVLEDAFIQESPKDGRFCYFKEVELMQSTGLKDKNGVEIFEGDVVKYKSFERFNELETVHKINVRYEPELCGFSPMCWNVVVDDGFYNYKVTEIEVLGNIHEHPNLLNKEMR